MYFFVAVVKFWNLTVETEESLWFATVNIVWNSYALCWFAGCLLSVNVTESDLSNSVLNGILYLEDTVDKASFCPRLIS